MSKALVCPCEDVTASEVEHAISKGYRDVESVKRYTGFGTGMCQGKECLTAVARLLEAKCQPTPRADQLLPFTPRPPLFPTELSHWASLGFDAFESTRSETAAIGRLCRGNANGDAQVDSGDGLAIRNEFLVGVLASGQPDCNEDGIVNSGDGLCVRQIFLGGSGACN